MALAEAFSISARPWIDAGDRQQSALAAITQLGAIERSSDWPRWTHLVIRDQGLCDVLPLLQPGRVKHGAGFGEGARVGNRQEGETEGQQ